jgi:hypothetical protein
MDKRITLPNGVVVEADSLSEILRVYDALWPDKPTQKFPGVDIDRIHFKLGKVKGLLPASTGAQRK